MAIFGYEWPIPEAIFFGTIPVVKECVTIVVLCDVYFLFMMLFSNEFFLELHARDFYAL